MTPYPVYDSVEFDSVEFKCIELIFMMHPIESSIPPLLWEVCSPLEKHVMMWASEAIFGPQYNPTLLEWVEEHQ